MKVYKYGARFVGPDQLVEDQLFAAHRYRNLLVEFQRARTAAVQATLDPYIAAEVAAAQAAIGKVAKAAAWKVVSARRSAAAKGPAKPLLQAIDVLYYDIRKRAYHASSACWGTKIWLDDAVEDATTFRRWGGEGTVAVQIQRGILPPALDSDTRARLRLLPPHLAEVQLRLGSDDERDPIWATWTIRYHRPLPAAGRIKWVTAKRERTGHRLDWYILFTVDVPIATGIVRDSVGPASCGIDVGWRRKEDGTLRAGYLAASNGHHEEILTPPAVERLTDRAAALQSEADELLVQVRDDLPELPRKTLQLLGLVEKMRAAGTEPPLSLLVWRSRMYQAGACRRRAQHVRENFYRVFAHRIAMTYGRVAVEGDFDLTTFAKRADDEMGNGVEHHRRVLARLAAPGELRVAIRQAVSARSLFVPAAAAHTTTTCITCGHVNAWTDEEHARLFVTCQGCAVVIDQDEQAAVNLCRAASAYVPRAAEPKKSPEMSVRQKRLRGFARDAAVIPAEPQAS